MPQTKKSTKRTKANVKPEKPAENLVETPAKRPEKITADTSTKLLLKKSFRDGLFFAVIIVVFNLIFVSKVEFGSLTFAQKIILILSSYVVALGIMTVIGFLFAYVERAAHRKKAKRAHVKKK